MGGGGLGWREGKLGLAPCTALPFINLRREVTTEGLYVVFPWKASFLTAVSAFFNYVLYQKEFVHWIVAMYMLIAHLVAARLDTRISPMSPDVHLI